MTIKDIMNVPFIKEVVYPKDIQIQRLCKIYSKSSFYFNHSCTYEKDNKTIIPIASKFNENRKRIIIELVLDHNNKKSYLRNKNSSRKELEMIKNSSISLNDLNLIELAVDIINNNYLETINFFKSTVAINRFNL